MYETRKKVRQRLAESFGRIKIEQEYSPQAERYFRKQDHTDAFQVISDKTCNDLDFSELFMFLDRTTSKVGQQVLYNTLRTVPSDRSVFAEQEKLIELVTRDPELRLKLQLQLDRLAGINAYYITSLFQEEHLKKPKWFTVIPLLSFSSLMCILLIPFTPQFFLLLLGIIIVNIVIHYWNKHNLYDYFGSIPQLLKLNMVAKEFLRYNFHEKTCPGLHGSIKVIDKVRNRMSFFKLEARLENDYQIAVWGILELFKVIFLLEPLLLFGVLEQLNTKRKEIEEVFSFVGYIDSAISIASLRQSLEIYCIPEISDRQKMLDAVGMYHPLIVNCVPNSINVEGKSILLTGSNMSGKTSFIRTIALNTVTGLTINTSFASRYTLSRFKTYSAIRISDDLMNDKSYYFEEVLTIKEMIEKSQISGSNLFLLDEIFKGTNTIERISAGKAVLSYLNNDTSIVFVSTHDIELADMLREDYELFHFSEQVDHQTVDFDYRLKSGKLKNRNAIRILEINNYPAVIIDEAVRLSREFDKNHANQTQP